MRLKFKVYSINLVREMSSKARKDPKKLLESLLSILPSNNRITLFLSMLPMDMTTTRTLFPDIVDDSELLMTLKDLFRLEISNGKIECKGNHIILYVGYFLRKLIDVILYNLSIQQSIRITWSHIVGKKIRDPIVELLITKLRLIKKSRYWNYCYKILNFVVQHGTDRIEIEKENVLFQIGLDPEKFEQAISILRNYEIVGYNKNTLFVYPQLNFYIQAAIAREYGKPDILETLRRALNEVK